MSTVDANLEWPRFCYSNAKDSQQDVTTAKQQQLKATKVPRKLNQSKTKMNNISPGDNNNVDSPANVEEQLVVVRSDLVATAGAGGGGGVVNGGQGGPAEKFAFSQLMRQMAQKYQDKNETTAERQPEQTFPFGHTPSETPPTGMPHFPIDPLILRAAFGPFFPFPIPSQANFFPTFSSSQALIALASKKQRPSQQEENIPSGMQSPPTSLKRERFEDPLDLSASQPNSKRIKEESDPVAESRLSVKTALTGADDPENWSVDRVVTFVENIETCQEYAEIFRNHSIDGSALLQLTENHMTRILGLKLGPAIKLRICIRDLVQKMNSANPSAKTPLHLANDK